MAVLAPPEEQTAVTGEQAARDVTQAIVDHLDRGVARVLIGDGLEEWEFPVRLLPENVTDGTVLLLEARGGTYNVLGIGVNQPTVEDRLCRGLNRRRPIAFPLPQRDACDEAPAEERAPRASRLLRDLGQ